MLETELLEEIRGRLERVLEMVGQMGDGELMAVLGATTTQLRMRGATLSMVTRELVEGTAKTLEAATDEQVEALRMAVEKEVQRRGNL